MGRVGSPRADDYDQLFLEDALIRGGMDPRQAEREAAMQVLREKQARAREGMPRDADGRPTLSPREAAFDADMAMAMGQDVSYGNGAEVDNLEAAGTPIVMDSEFGTTNARLPVTYRVPGPRDSNNYAEPGAPIYDDEEAADYVARQSAQGVADELRVREMGSVDSPYRGGDELPSARDRDMYARGMVPTINPLTGAVGYTVAYPRPDATGQITEGRPGVRGVRRDLQGPVIDTATGKPIPNSHKYEKNLYDGPLGQTEVYAPSPEFRAELQEREDRNRTRRLATRAGFTPESAAIMATSGEPQNLDQLRAMGDARRDAAKADRQQAVIRRAQARYNPMEYMNRDDISDWNRMVAANSLLGPRGYRGATPLDVEGAHNRQLTDLGLRVAQGQGFQQLTPEQRQLVEIKAAEAERGVPAEERAAKYRDAPAVHPSETDMVDSYVGDMYSVQSGWALGGTTSSFTAEEQQATVDWLVNEKGYKPEKARQIVDGVARKRNAQSWWGNFE